MEEELASLGLGHVRADPIVTSAAQGDHVSLVRVENVATASAGKALVDVHGSRPPAHHAALAPRTLREELCHKITAPARLGVGVCGALGTWAEGGAAVQG